MPTEELVPWVADGMVAGGEKPTPCRVAVKFPMAARQAKSASTCALGGGSAAGNSTRGSNVLPENLDDAIEAFSGDVRERARQEKTFRFGRGRDQAAATRVAEAEDREHLLGFVERLQAEKPCFSHGPKPPRPIDVRVGFGQCFRSPGQRAIPPPPGLSAGGGPCRNFLQQRPGCPSFAGSDDVGPARHRPQARAGRL